MLEIGFGDGATLVEVARARPDLDFLGVEVHPPGVGHCLLGIEAASRGAAEVVLVESAPRVAGTLRSSVVELGLGDRVRLEPGHVDPTVARHEHFWVVDGEDVVDQWAIDLRHW